MAIYEQERPAGPQPETDRFDIWEDEVDDIPFSHLGRKAKERHVALNGTYLGQLHLDESQDGNEAVSDGFYPGSDGQEILISSPQWEVLAIQLYAGGITKARRIIYPGGRRVFLEAI